jgi:hypothetical protein
MQLTGSSYRNATATWAGVFLHKVFIVSDEIGSILYGHPTPYLQMINWISKANQVEIKSNAVRLELLLIST